MFKSKRSKSGKPGNALRFQNTAVPTHDEHLSQSFVDEAVLNTGKNATAVNNNGTNGISKQAKNNNVEVDLNMNDQVVPPPPMDETEQILLRLHSSLIDFYTKHKPENVDEDVLTILMQFFIDAGGVALNRKLMDKYGEDLNTFSPLNDDEIPPPPAEYSQTLERVKRTSLSSSLNSELGIQVPPTPKIEMDKQPSSPIQPRHSKKFNTNKKKKKKPQDEELKQYMEDQHKKSTNLEAEVDKQLGLDTVDVTEDAEEKEKKLRLDVLDKPDNYELTARDLIEAFYAKHDESKLEKDTGIEKFVMWVEKYSLQGLSDKLKSKYGEGLYDVQKLARRRRNLEDALTAFYLKHDRAKLETRWTIMKILSWTMLNGVLALNRKFKTRYGLDVVAI